MDVKSVNFVMHIPYVILGVLTKWHIQIVLLLAAVSFLSSIMFEF
jgi:hypothetical protein